MGWVTRLKSGLGIFVAATLAAPLLAFAVLGIRAASQSPLESASSPEPLIASVERQEREREVNVAIKVEYADALAPTTSASGTATSVTVAPGDEVTTGTVVARVNDAAITAYSSPSPLWRDLAHGAEGGDVRVAQDLLRTLGYYSGSSDGRVGYTTEKAIKAYNAARGYGSGNGYLSLASLTWIGTGPVTVASVTVHAGDQVSPGTELFTTTAALAAITVSETPNIVRDAEVVLVVNGITTPYVAGSGRVTDPEAVAAIAASLGTATEGLGSVKLTVPISVGAIPSSAIVSEPEGATCFFPDLTSPGVVVTPLGGSLGTVDVDVSLVGQPVLVNPREVREDLSCG